MPKTYPVYGQMEVAAIVTPPSQINGGISINPYSNVNLTPAATGALILDEYILPAFALDRAGNGLYLYAFATTAANANAKTLLFNFAGTGAIGAVVTGGTTIATTTTSVSGTALLIEAWVYKTAAAAQTYAGFGTAGATLAAPTSGTLTVSDTALIQINLVANAATTATDLTVQFWQIQYIG